MHLKKLIFPFLLFTLSSFSLFADIVHANSIEEVKKLIGPPNEKTLVIFDMDHTLIIPVCPAFQHNNIVSYRSILDQIEWSPEQRGVASNLSNMAYRVQLLERQTVGYILYLQQQKVPTIALTAAMTGSLGKIKDIVQWRQKQLLQFGIDFSRTAPYLSRFQLDNLTPFLGTYPEGVCGVICTNRNMKGPVLAAYLKLIDWMPEKVFLVDDTLKQVESLVEPMQKLGIDYTGIHYLAKDFHRGAPIDEVTFLCLWKEIEKQTIQVIKERTLEPVYDKR